MHAEDNSGSFFSSITSFDYEYCYNTISLIQVISIWLYQYETIMTSSGSNINVRNILSIFIGREHINIMVMILCVVCKLVFFCIKYYLYRMLQSYQSINYLFYDYSYIICIEIYHIFVYAVLRYFVFCHSFPLHSIISWLIILICWISCHDVTFSVNIEHSHHCDPYHFILRNTRLTGSCGIIPNEWTCTRQCTQRVRRCRTVCLCRIYWIS